MLLKSYLNHIITQHKEMPLLIIIKTEFSKQFSIIGYNLILRKLRGYYDYFINSYRTEAIHILCFLIRH